MAAGPCAIYFPQQKVYALAASAVFWLPVFKHLMTWLGCQPASRTNLKKLLKVRLPLFAVRTTCCNCLTGRFACSPVVVKEISCIAEIVASVAVDTL